MHDHTLAKNEQDRAASLSAMVDTLKREMGSAMTRQDELSQALTTQVGLHLDPTRFLLKKIPAKVKC